MPLSHVHGSGYLLKELHPLESSPPSAPHPLNYTIPRIPKQRFHLTHSLTPVSHLRHLLKSNYSALAAMISFTNAIFALATFQAANAALFITFPVQGSTCAVGSACQVRWIDNPNVSGPLITSLGEVSIDLVAGDPSNLKTAQQLGGVSNPAAAMAVTFTPISTLSPAQPYAIRITPKSNPSGVIFSTFFHITGGTGTGIIPGSASAPGNTTSLKSSSSLLSVTNSSSALANTTSNLTSSAKSVLSNSSSLSPSMASHNTSSSVNTTVSANASKSASSYLKASSRAVVCVAFFSLGLLL